MRKLIMQLDLTLDGFNNEDNWPNYDPEAWQQRVEQDSTVGTVLMGRKIYEIFYPYWPAQANNPAASETNVAFSRWLDEIPKVVFSKTLEKTEWKNSRLVKTDLAEEVSRLKKQAGKDILLLHSSSIAQECMKHGLIDEYWLNILPIALGSGLPLFKERVNLELLDSKPYPSGQVYLHYKTARRE